MAEVSDWLKTVRFATAYDKMNNAKNAFSGFSPEIQNMAQQISNLYSGMAFQAEDNANDYDARTAAARQAMLDQFAQTDANTQAAYTNSQNYQSEIAKRLGLEGTLQGPGVENQNQQTNQVLALNKANRTNQQASYDLLRGGYGELIRDRIGSFDVQAGTSLANLLSQLQAQQAAAAAAKGSGGGGRGGGGSGSKSAGPGFATENGSTFMSINPYNPPSGSTYSSDYVRPDIGRGSIGWKGSPSVSYKAKPKTPGSRAYSVARGTGNTSRAYSIAHPSKKTISVKRG